MTDDLSVAQIRQRIVEIRPEQFQGIVYRSASPRYASEHDLLSGVGASKGGGRWNRVGAAAVYCSMTPEAALAETLAIQRYYGWPDHGALPRIFVAIEVDLACVLDLTAGLVRRKLRISETRMLEADWRAEMAVGAEPLTHKIGQAAIEAGFEAIKVSSATDQRGPNLVVFPQNVLSTSRLRLSS